MPDFDNFEQGTVNFLGRLLKEILRITHFSNSRYVDYCSSFYSINGDELFTPKIIGLIGQCIGTTGL